MLALEHLRKFFVGTPQQVDPDKVELERRLKQSERELRYLETQIRAAKSQRGKSESAT